MDSKRLAALSRKAMGAHVSILRAAGLSYEKIEEELRLRPNRGMTAWRLEGNKHAPPVTFIKQAAGSLEGDLAKEESDVH